MHMAMVSIICVALIVFGGTSMAQSFLTSVDKAALSIEKISVREGKIMRTKLATVSAENVHWADLLRVTLENSGQIKLASFSKWDFIVDYYDGSSTHYTSWFPYTSGELPNNEWQKIGIYLNGATELFEPGILNPGEEMVIVARPSPSLGADTTAHVVICTPNGVPESISFPVGPDYPLLTPHSENMTIAFTEYYQLKEGIRSEGTGITEVTKSINTLETGRWLLHNESDDSRLGRHVYSLAGIDQIPASTWTVYYRTQATGEWGALAYPSLSIDIIIRMADGTIRKTIAVDVAQATLASPYEWQTIFGSYSFPGYRVVDYTDYLEIDYYGKSSGSGPLSSSYIELRVDDSDLGNTDQTRVKA